MKNTEYKNLYETLTSENTQYILANQAESVLDENWPLWDAMSEYNARYFEDMEDKELQDDYGWNPEYMDRYEFIQEQEYPEVYQTFIVDAHTYQILEDYGELIWYNEDMSMHFWGVMHYGTAWSYVMKNEPIRQIARYQK